MSEREARIHKVSEKELAAAGLEVPTLGKKTPRKVRPTGGLPKKDDEVKIIRSGNQAVIGSFGRVLKVEPIASRLGPPDALLTVRVTLHIGERESRWIRYTDVLCFASHVEVHRTLRETVPDIDKEEDITEDGVDRLMRQGMER